MNSSETIRDVAINNQNTEHKAVCQDCNFEGDWRATPQEADVDRRSHQAVNGHIVEIITRQWN